MSEPARGETLHASCVAIAGAGVLIVGPSGAGKSDLALRLIDRGAVLVADDCTIVRRDGNRLIAAPPETIAGRIEVRGVGIEAMRHAADIAVALVVAIDRPVERMPAWAEVRDICGVAIPVLALAGFEASAPIKLELALRRLAAEEGR